MKRRNPTAMVIPCSVREMSAWPRTAETEAVARSGSL